MGSVRHLPVRSEPMRTPWLGWLAAVIVLAAGVIRTAGWIGGGPHNTTAGILLIAIGVLMLGAMTWLRRLGRRYPKRT